MDWLADDSVSLSDGAGYPQTWRENSPGNFGCLQYVSRREDCAGDYKEQVRALRDIDGDGFLEWRIVSRTVCDADGNTVLVEGLQDIDGDGKADHFRVDDDGTGGSVLSWESQPSGAYVLDEAFVDRLARIDTMRSRVRIGYESAKSHPNNRLPSPQIVVASVQATTFPDPTTAVSSTYHRGRLIYDPYQQSWRFPGYGLVVQSTDSDLSHPGPDAISVFLGWMPLGDEFGSLIDYLADTPTLWKTLAYAGRAVLRYDGVPTPGLTRDQIALSLSARGWGGPVDDWMYQRSGLVEYGVKVVDVPNADAWPVIVPYDAVTRTHYQGQGGDWAFAAGSGVDVVSVDDYGNPLLIDDRNDLADPFDDVCYDYEYAASPDDEVQRPIVNAPSSVRQSSCHQGTTATLRRDRYRYDGDSAFEAPLAEGLVDRGNLAEHRVERYNKATGAAIDTVLRRAFDYDYLGNVRAVRDYLDAGAFVETQIVRDDDARLPVEVRVAPGTAAEQVSTVAWDDWDRIASQTDANGVLHTFDYTDPFGRLKSHVVTPPGGSAYTLEALDYSSLDADDEAIGDPMWIEARVCEADGACKRTRSYFDGAGRALQTRLDVGGGSAMVLGDSYYDLAGRLRRQADPYPSSGMAFARNVWEYGTLYGYDAEGRLSAAADVGGLLDSGPIFPPATSRFGDAYLTTFTRSLLGNRHRIQRRGPSQNDPDGSEYGSYDETEVDGVGRVRQAWNGQRPTTGGIAAAAERIAYSYHPTGELRAVERAGNPADALSAVVATAWEVDSDGLPVRFSDDTGSDVTSTYDPQGRLLRQSFVADGWNTSIVQSYDALGRLAARWHERTAETGGPAPCDPFTGRLCGVFSPILVRGVGVYLYDDDPAAPEGLGAFRRGRLASVQDEAGTLHLGYDELGRPTGAAREFSPWLDGQFAVRAAYRRGGEVASVAYDLPGLLGADETVSYAYNLAGTLLGVSGSGQATPYWQALEVNTMQQVGRAAYGNGLVEHRTYRADRRRQLLARVIKDGSGATLLNQAFTRIDGEGRLRRASETVGGVTALFGYE